MRDPDHDSDLEEEKWNKPTTKIFNSGRQVIPILHMWIKTPSPAFLLTNKNVKVMYVIPKKVLSEPGIDFLHCVLPYCYHRELFYQKEVVKPRKRINYLYIVFLKISKVHPTTCYAKIKISCPRLFLVNTFYFLYVRIWVKHSYFSTNKTNLLALLHEFFLLLLKIFKCYNSCCAF